jgi:hypothetical protein
MLVFQVLVSAMFNPLHALADGQQEGFNHTLASALYTDPEFG